MVTLFILALALSADAFAAAVSQGAATAGRPRAGHALFVGFAFGLAQGLMPLLGALLGVAFEKAARDLDHWIAFVLLAAIGAHMVREGLDSDPEVPNARSTRKWTVVVAAFATSIDAAAAGVTLPLIDQPVALACAMIGFVTFFMSTAGVYFGALAGSLIGRRAALIGGLLLVGIGTNILIEHLFFGG